MKQIIINRILALLKEGKHVVTAGQLTALYNTEHSAESHITEAPTLRLLEGMAMQGIIIKDTTSNGPPRWCACDDKMSKNKKQIEAWKEARVQNYITTRSQESLARMLVDLEDSSRGVPEFEITEEWPAGVRHMKRP